jgi:chromosome segregation ATPase
MVQNYVDTAMTLERPSEEEFDGTQCSGTDRFHQDIQHLLARVSGFEKAACDYLMLNSMPQTKSRYRFSPMTIGIFLVVLAITFALNIVLVVLRASPGQLLVSNAGISALHILVGLCVLSDLTRSKAYFQNERDNLRQRLQRVNSQLRELIEVRHQWNHDLQLCKSSIETEQLRLQLVVNEIYAKEEKLAFCSELLADRERDLNLCELKAEETKRAINDISIQLQQMQTVLETTADEVEGLTGEIQRKHEEQEKLVRETDLCEAKRTQLELSVSNCEQQLDEKRTELELLEQEQLRLDDVLGQQKKALTLAQLELDSVRDEKNKAHDLYMDWMNQSLALESEVASIREAIALGKAELQQLGRDTLELSSKNQDLREIAAEHERTNAHLLMQMGEFERLSVAKSIFEASEVVAQVTVPLAAEPSGEDKVPNCDNRAELEQRRSELEAFAEQLAIREAQLNQSLAKSELALRDSEKAVSDAERRVELLTEKAEGLAEQVNRKSQELFEYKEELIQVRAEQRDIEAVNSEVAKLQACVADLQSEMERRQDVLNRMDAMVAETDVNYEAKQREGRDLEIRISELQSELLDVSQSLAAQVDEHDRFNELVHGLVQEHSTLEEANETTSLEIAKSKRELEQVVSQLEQLRAEMTRLSDERDLQNAAIDSANHTLWQLREEIAESGVSQQRLVEIEGLQHETELRIHDLQREIDSLNLERDGLQQEIEEFRTLHSTETQRLAEIGQLMSDAELRANAAQDRQVNLELRLEELNAMEGEARERHLQLTELIGDSERRRVTLVSEVQALESKHDESVLRLHEIADAVKDAECASQQWKEYVKMLENEVQEKQKSRDVMDNQIESLRQEKLALELALHNASDQLQTLEQRVIELRDESSNAEQSLLDAQKDLERALTEHKLVVGRNIEASHCHENIMAAILNAEQDLAQMQAQVADEHQQVFELEQTKRGLAHDITLMEKDLDARFQQLEEQSHHNDVLQAKHRDIEASIEQLLQETQSLEATKASWLEEEPKFIEMKQSAILLRSDVSELELQRNTLETEVERLDVMKSELQSLEVTHADMEARLANLRTELITGEKEIQALNAEIESLQGEKSQYDELREAHQAEEAQLDRLLQTMANRRQELSVVEAELQEKREDSKNLEAHLESGKQKANELELQLTKINKESKHAEHQLECHRREVEKLASHRRSLEQGIADLMQKMDDLEASSQKARHDCVSAEMSKSHFEAQVEALQLRVEELQNIGNECERCVRIAKEKVAQETDVLNNSIERIASAQLQESNLEEIVATLERNRDEAEAALKSIYAEVTVKSAELENVIQQRNAVRNEIEALRIELAAQVTQPQQFVESVQLVSPARETRGNADQMGQSQPLEGGAAPLSLDSMEEGIAQTLQDVQEIATLVRDRTILSTETVRQQSSEVTAQRRERVDAWSTVFSR